MSPILKLYAPVAILLAGLLALSSCSELKSNLPTQDTSLKVHPDGWLTTASGNFHGKFVKANGFDVNACQKCHGTQFNGGTSGVSCLSCHYPTSAAENCTACHGTAGVNAAPPVDLAGNSARSFSGVGAHQIHLTGGTFSATLTCATCHNVPPAILSPGHLDHTAGAEVRFDSVKFVAPNQVYAAGTSTCGTTYCHGNFRNGNSTNVVTWTDVSGTGAACGTCHGDKNLSDPEDRARPKTISQGGTHPDKGAFGTTHCSNCHGSVVNSSLNFVDRSKHIDGALN